MPQKIKIVDVVDKDDEKDEPYETTKEIEPIEEKTDEKLEGMDHFTTGTHPVY